jgi:hypothetical protein
VRVSARCPRRASDIQTERFDRLPTKVLEPLRENPGTVQPLRVVRPEGHQHTDPPHSIEFLRARRAAM